MNLMYIAGKALKSQSKQSVFLHLQKILLFNWYYMDECPEENLHNYDLFMPIVV